MGFQRRIENRGYPFVEADIVRLDTATGILHGMNDVRHVVLDEDFINAWQAEVSSSCGDEAPSIFDTLGFEYGKSFAAAIRTRLSAHYGVPAESLPLARFQFAVAQAFALEGWGELNLDFEHSEAGFVCATIGNPCRFESGEDRAGGEAFESRFASSFLAGILSELSGGELAGKATSCADAGDESDARVLRFVITGAERLRAIASQLGAEATHGEWIAALERCATTRP